MSGGIDFSRFFSIQTTAGTAAGLTNIELVLTAPAPASLTNTDQVNNLPMGDLFVVTNVEFPPPSNSPLFNPINYTTQTHLFRSGALNLGGGITTPTVLTPKPSSFTMLGVGVGVASTLLMARGRRRPARLV